MASLIRRNPPFSPFSELSDAEILLSPYRRESFRRDFRLQWKQVDATCFGLNEFPTGQTCPLLERLYSMNQPQSTRTGQDNRPRPLAGTPAERVEEIKRRFPTLPSKSTIGNVPMKR